MVDRLSLTRKSSGEPVNVRDQIFAAPTQRIADFDFGQKTASVFDDMLGRSVPFYGEMQRMIGELASDYATEGTAIYDLGCSTGTTILQIAANIPRDRNIRYVGIDSSPEMLAIARQKLADAGFDRPFDLTCGDLNTGVPIEGASVALLVLTLQFIRPLYRQRLIRSIYEGLTDNGALILVEKVLGENSEFNRLFIHHYYEMKRENGYSDLEIAQKREALENILVPYRLEENKELLREQGFRHVDVFFKWYNFCAIIATK
jgi:tRNA (cmo5U34)-methyltransferase